MNRLLRAGAVALIAGGLARAALRRRRRLPGFAGRAVVVTGGSKGLGLLLARRFAAEGADLALLARDAATLERAAAEIRRRYGARVLALSCDVRERREVEEAIAAAVGAFGRLDVLVNNAGVIHAGPFEATSDADFDAALDTHLRGALHAVRATLPHLRRSGRGRIVNVASIGGLVAVPHLSAYSASKFALVGFSDALRAELAPLGVRVTTACPWLIRTGSHYNVHLRGDPPAELAWFALADALPGVSWSAERAADRIVEACRHGEARVIVGPQGKFAARVAALFPDLVAAGAAAAARLLPAVGAGEAQRGWEARAHTPLAPSLLTRLADRATDRNNERPPPPPRN